MPQSALRKVAVDYCVPVSEMPDLLVRLTGKETKETVDVSMNENKKNGIEIRIAAGYNALETGVEKLGAPSRFTCPDCRGVMLKVKDGNIIRFRCHTGHAYSAETFLQMISESAEQSLWTAIRAVEETVMLVNFLGGELGETGEPELAALYAEKAREAQARADAVIRVVMKHEPLSADKLRQEV